VEPAVDSVEQDRSTCSNEKSAEEGGAADDEHRQQCRVILRRRLADGICIDQTLRS